MTGLVRYMNAFEMGGVLSRAGCAAVVLAAGAMSAAVANSGAARQPPRLVLIGTYTGAKSEGIYAFRFDASNGSLAPAGLAAQTENPSFLAVHPNGRWVYAVNETATFDGEKSGAVSAFALDRASARLTLINRQSSRGGSPCYISVHPAGGHVLVANYSGGSVSVLPIAADGSLGEAASVVQHTGSSAHPKRQQQAHAHAIKPNAAGRFALAADLGIDQVLVYRFEAGGRLVPHEPAAATLPAGSGPRHLSFHPSGRAVYVINELASTVTAFEWDADAGTLVARQTLSTLPADHTGTSYTAEVVTAPSGRFLYGSNRGHDSLAIFAIDAGGGLSLVGHEPTGGRWPRHFALDPDGGRWLIAANQHSDSLVVFRTDDATGKLQRVGAPVSVGSPACVTFAGPLGD